MKLIKSQGTGHLLRAGYAIAIGELGLMAYSSYARVTKQMQK
jgi:hypothetical protein